MALLAGFVPAGVWMTRFAMRIAAQELRCRIEAAHLTLCSGELASLKAVAQHMTVSLRTLNRDFHPCQAVYASRHPSWPGAWLTRSRNILDGSG